MRSILLAIQGYKVDRGTFKKLADMHGSHILCQQYFFKNIEIVRKCRINNLTDKNSQVVMILGVAVWWYVPEISPFPAEVRSVPQATSPCSIRESV